MDINRFKLLDREGLPKALRMNKHDDIANILENKNINGNQFLQLSERDLVQWNLNIAQKKAVWACLVEINANPSKYITKKLSFGKGDIKTSHVANNFNKKLEEALLGSPGNLIGSSRTVPRINKTPRNPDSPGINPSSIPKLVPRPKPQIPTKDMNKIKSTSNLPRNNRPSFPLPQPPPQVLPTTSTRPPVLPPPYSDYIVMSPPQAPRSSPVASRHTLRKNIEPPNDDGDYLTPNDVKENEYEAEPRQDSGYRRRPPIEIPMDDELDLPPPPLPALPSTDRESRKNVRVFLPPPPSEDYEPMEDSKATKTTANKDKISPVFPRHNSFSDKIRDSLRKLVNHKYENVVIVDPVESGKTSPVSPSNLIVTRPLPPIPFQTESVPTFSEKLRSTGPTSRPLPSLPDENELEIGDNNSNDNFSEDGNDLDTIEEPIYENVIHRDMSEIHTEPEKKIHKEPEKKMHKEPEKKMHKEPEKKIHKEPEKKIPSHLTGLLANLTKALEKQQRFTVGGKEDELRKPLVNVDLRRSPSIIENQQQSDPEEELPEYGNLPANPLSHQEDSDQFYGNVDSSVSDNGNPNSCSKCKTEACSCKWTPKKLENPSNNNSKKSDIPTSDQTKSCGCKKPNCDCSLKPSPPTRNLPQQISSDDNEYYNTVINLNNEPYYRNTDRKGAKLLLQDLEDGAFVLRPGKMHFLVLTVKYMKKYYNLGIVKTPDDTFKCDCTSDDPLEFRTIRDFLDYFKQEPLTLQGVNEVVNVKLKPVLQ